MEDNEADLRSLIKEIRDRCKDSDGRTLRMEASLKTIQASLERIEETLDDTQFSLSRTEREVSKTNKATAYLTRWVVTGVVISVICLILSIVFYIHISRGTTRHLEETKIEVNKVLEEIRGGKHRGKGDSCNGSGSEAVNMRIQYSYPPKLVLVICLNSDPGIRIYCVCDYYKHQ